MNDLAQYCFAGLGKRLAAQASNTEHFVKTKLQNFMNDIVYKFHENPLH